jgi:hypothetical protein
VLETKKGFLKFFKNELTPIRLKLTQLLLLWIGKYYFDFDEELIQEFMSFSKIMFISKGETYAGMLLQTLSNKQTYLENEKKKMLDLSYLQKYPKSILPKKMDEILNYSQIEFSRQFTLFEYDTFQKIQPKELMNTNWLKNSQLSPNIKQLTGLFNKFSNFITKTIVFERNLKKRSKLIENFILIASEFQKLKNYNGVFEVLSGLNNSSVSRLKKTWKLVSFNLINKFEELMKYIDNKNNFSYLRNAQTYNTTDTCLPCKNY